VPFTPFHFGPGAAIKAVIPTRFSFSAFCYAQIVTDIESAYHLLIGEYPVHRFLHSYMGATVTALFCALTVRPLCRILNVWFRCSISVAWKVAFLSAFIGTYSHVLLDSIMHRDIVPLKPFNASNGMYRVISVDLLHIPCVVLGVGAVCLHWARNGRKFGRPGK
jgi:membrane-bound metal-dependent hydrolase YbcI (DUF457 family)